MWAARGGALGLALPFCQHVIVIFYLVSGRISAGQPVGAVSRAASQTWSVVRLRAVSHPLRVCGFGVYIIYRETGRLLEEQTSPPSQRDSLSTSSVLGGSAQRANNLRAVASSTAQSLYSSLSSTPLAPPMSGMAKIFLMMFGSPPACTAGEAHGS